MTKLVIPEAALEQHAAILAKTGAGKSYAARGFLEWLLDQGRRVCVIDPTGVHWGIRLKRDGKKPSPYPVVIFGGDHADVPVAATSGTELGKLIATSNLPCVIDVLHFGVGERQRFFTDLAHALMRHNRLPLQLFIDEAHEFMPQSGYGEKSPQRGAMINAGNRLVAGGRARGLRVTLISQRAAKVHKDSLTQIETLIAMKLIHKLDRNAVEDWVKACAEPEDWKRVEKSLAKLETGTGWVWAPALDVLTEVKFPLIQTFDSFRPAADEDEAQAAPVALADIDLEQLRGQLSETKPAKRETKGSDALRQRNAELERAVRDLEARLQAEQRETGRLAAAMQRATQALTEAAEASSHRQVNGSGSSSAPSDEGRKVNTAPAPAAPTPAAPDDPAHDDPLVVAARSVWPARLTWGQLTAMCGRKARGGYFSKVKRSLLESGVVREVGGKVELTDPPELGDRIPADVLEEVLPGLAGEMFRAIRENPGYFDQLGLGNHLGKAPRGGHWSSNFRILKQNGLVLEEGNALRVNPELEGEL